MQNRLIPWTVEIKNLVVNLPVGTADRERKFQPVRVDVSLRAIASAFPQTISDCLNYQPICIWMVEDWPLRSPMQSLETKLLELMRFIFDYDVRVEWVDVAMSRVGENTPSGHLEVRASTSRADLETTLESRMHCLDREAEPQMFGFNV